jgi:hypothetical protein
VNLEKLLNINTSKLLFEKFTEKSVEYLHFYACANIDVSVGNKVKHPKITADEYKQVIALHECMFHANPSVMALAIRDFA